MAKKPIKEKPIGSCSTCDNHFGEYNEGANRKLIMCKCTLSEWNKLMSGTCKDYKQQIKQNVC